MITNAPGLSAFNPVERKMFHLSKEMTGLILPAEKHGTHLKNGKTVNIELEKKNFQYAGELLSEVWNELVIDGHPVHSEYKSELPKKSTLTYKVSTAFKQQHVLETQYFTCVLKCDNRDCCQDFETPVLSYFPHRRIPALIPIEMTTFGPQAVTMDKNLYKQLLRFPSLPNRVLLESSIVSESLLKKYNGKIPYDIYFPTVQDKIDGRICSQCHNYFGSRKSLHEHERLCKPKPLKRKKTGNVQRKNKKITQRNNVISDSESDTSSSESESDSEVPCETDSAPEDYESSDPDSDWVEYRNQEQTSTTVEGDIEIINRMRDFVSNPWTEI